MARQMKFSADDLLALRPSTRSVPPAETRRVKGELRTCTVSWETRKLADGSVRISGYANRYTVDRYGTIFEPSAFAAALPVFKGNPVMLWQHDTERPIGLFDTFEIRRDGLWVSGVIIPGTEASDEAINRVLAGVVKSLSIGFRIFDGYLDDSDIDEMKDAFHVSKLELYEISIVTVPGNRESNFTVDSTGRLLKVEPQDDTQPQRGFDPATALTDDMLRAECARRGLTQGNDLPPPLADSPALEPEEHVRPILQGWRTGTCAGCTRDNIDVMPFAEVGDNTWHLCGRCIVEGSTNEMKTIEERLAALEEKTEDHEQRLVLGATEVSAQLAAHTETIGAHGSELKDVRSAVVGLARREVTRLERSLGVKPAGTKPADAGAE
jgi:HK97 family phage prohead protease